MPFLIEGRTGSSAATGLEPEFARIRRALLRDNAGLLRHHENSE